MPLQIIGVAAARSHFEAHRAAGMWRMVAGSAATLIYTVVMLTNFLSCLWLLLGRREAPVDGWLTQNYRALLDSSVNQLSM